jgi:cytokinin dehydrogenase
MTDASRIERDLSRTVRGTVAATPDAATRHAMDYGRILDRAPHVVVRPADANDLAAVVRYARRAGLSLTAQGAAHSQGGQSLSDGGVLLDMRGFGAAPHIDAAARCVTVGAGALWRDVVAAALPHGLVPPVLTSNLYTTVGGTASVGGIGRSSFRHGTQLDNHLELEVVTGGGEVVTCTADRRRELFEHALGGLGQFGIITRVRHRLRPHGPRVCRCVGAYASLDALLDGADHVVAGDAADAVVGLVGAEGGRWRYALAAEAESGDEDWEPVWRLATALRGAERPLRHRTTPLAAAVLPPPAPPRHRPWSGARAVVAPGVDLVLPRAAAAPFIGEVLDWLPPRVRARAEVVLLFLRRARLTRPMFVTPDAESLVVLTLEPALPAADAGELVTLLERVLARGRDVGATQYLAGWVHREPAAWREHYGARWPAVARAKRRYDPSGVLTSAGVRLPAADAGPDEVPNDLPDGGRGAAPAAV